MNISTYSRGLKAKSHKTGLTQNVLIINNATFHIRDIEHRERINRITLQLTTFNQDLIFYVIYTLILSTINADIITNKIQTYDRLTNSK